MPASELRSLVASRVVSPVEIVDACLDRILGANPAINAFCLIAETHARSAAQDAERRVASGRELGALHGVPVAIKDSTAVSGLRTTYGSRAFAHHVSDEDAISVARLRAAGAILIGKTTMPECGAKAVCESPLLGRTNNPWDLARTAGGSSGGSAAAVAAEMVPLAEGTDGAGSIRIPASCCGVVGLKPSFGRIPLHPRSPFGSLVQQGPLARTTRDAAVMLEAMAGPASEEAYGAHKHRSGEYLEAVDEPDLRGWRIAYTRDLGLDSVAPDVVAHTEAAARLFVDLGAEVEAITPKLPDPREPMMMLWTAICGSHCRDMVLPNVDRAEVDPDLLTMMEGAEAIDAISYVKADIEFRREFHLALLRVFDRFRILLTPTLSRPAMEHPTDGLNPTGIDGTDAERFLAWLRTYHFNLTGQPAASVPCGRSAEGMPIGLQIVGRPRADHDVLRAAAAFEAAAPWPDAVPFDLERVAPDAAAPSPLVV